MELVEVKIKTQAITARYGVLSTGDILRTDAAYARHLVKEANAGTYVHEKDDVEPESLEAPATVKPSDGLNVAELKAALEAKGIAIPDGAKKTELVALLDGEEVIK